MEKYSINVELKANFRDYPIIIKKEQLAKLIGLPVDQFTILPSYEGFDGKVVPHFHQTENDDERQSSLSKCLCLMKGKEPILYISVKADEESVTFDRYIPCGNLPSQTLAQQHVRFDIATENLTDELKRNIVFRSDYDRFVPNYYRHLHENVPLHIAEVKREPLDTGNEQLDSVMILRATIPTPSDFNVKSLPYAMWIEEIVVANNDEVRVYTVTDFKNTELDFSEGNIHLTIASDIVITDNDMVREVKVGFYHGYRIDEQMELISNFSSFVQKANTTITF